ncbi:hypothetical protein [Curtobacterium sp. VKM Ac-1393]|uniref:hypothetical protein n=1 Tax=Curtobacterium sp. VKM Ac-1393 TaxID=2783814 RepID=UPI00188C6446|nr:hypothetical protein [Curtobacterium sp. VKM Ac-1393]MBF4607328.1 hypothetical protein [Curtobacterium sp. VKM Ac-1393]
MPITLTQPHKRSRSDHLGGDQLRPNARINTTPQSASVIVPVDVSVLNSPRS